MSALILLPLFAAMWFFMIRPQQQRIRAQRALVLAIQAGDEVITAGGLIGTITVLGDREVNLDVGNGTEIRVLRTAISARVPPAVTGLVEEG